MASILILVSAAFIVLQIPMVQSELAERATEKLSEHLDADIHIGKIHIKPFTNLIIKDVQILDKKPLSDTSANLMPVDTFFVADYITVTFSLKGLVVSEGLHFDKARIENGEMNLVIEEDNDVNLVRIFNLPSEGRLTEKELFYIKRVELDNFCFRLKNYSSTRPILPEGGINWNDMNIYNINILAHHLHFKNAIMSGEVERLSFKEKSGYICHQISGNAKVGKGRSIITEIRLLDPWSNLYVPYYTMSFKSPDDFSDYIHKIKMTGYSERSKLHFNSLRYFAPGLENNNTYILLDGNMYGTVDSLYTDNIRIDAINGSFSASVSGGMTGLPDLDKTKMNFRVHSLNMTTKGLESFLNRWTGEKKIDIADIAKGTMFNATGQVKGPLNYFQADLKLKSKIGAANLSAHISNVVKEGKAIGLEGNLKTMNLDFGQMFNSKIVGQCTMTADVDATLGTKEELKVILKKLTIEKLHLNDYDYSSIAAVGTLSAQDFNGKIICNDPALNFMLQGSFALSPKTKNALYKFYANVGHADLRAMNIDKRGVSKVRFQTIANFSQISRGDIIGKIDIDGLKLENQAGKYDVGKISLSSHSNEDIYRMSLKSSFIQASYTGTSHLGNFIKDLINVSLKKETSALYKKPEYKWENHKYDLNLKFQNTMDVLSFILPGLYIADSTTVKASIKPDESFTAELESPRIAYKEQYLRNLKANINNRDTSLRAQLESREARFATMVLKNNNLNLFANNNRLGLSYSYNNEGELENKGELYATGHLSRTVKEELGINLDFLPSSIFINSQEWNIRKSAIAIEGKDIHIPNLEFDSHNQKISLSGGISKTKIDTLQLAMDKFNLGIINPLLQPNMGIQGELSGIAMLTSPTENFGILVDIVSENTAMSNEPLGVLNAKVTWNENFNRFDLLAWNELGDKKNLNAKGNYYPSIKRLEASADLNELNMGYASVFLKDVFSEFRGKISGKISAEGPINRPKITSENTYLKDAVLAIDFTKVPYYAEGKFSMDEWGIYFDDISIKDRHKGTGTLSGSINYSHFNNFSFDTRIRANEIEAINLKEKDSEYFYGNLFGTGNINIYGPLSSVQMDIDAVTAKTGSLHIPIPNTAVAGTTNLLKFKEPDKIEWIDPYELMIAKLRKREQIEGDFGVKLKVGATPAVEVFVEIDKASGNVLSGRGSGVITLDILESRDIFDISGDYTLNSGQYHFVALGIASRDFSIQDGSSVRFGGDIFESKLDIDAIYKTKASISTLISDTTSVSNRRTVECGIKITDKLLNPSLGFSINIPDIDPTIKARVDNALSTPDKIQKQFLSLIISNNFLPDEQSGIVNNSSVLYSNMSEIMSNQINNIFQKLNIPLDLGLNYQPNDKGTDIFDVAVSTQLFNNRLIVNGNIGNKQRTIDSNNDIVGDIDIEIKLDNSGSVRLNLFSHSADQYTNYLDNSQRNGVGITYQKEFNSFLSWLKNAFSSKAKREEARREEEKALIDEGRTVLEISENRTTKTRRHGKG